MSRYLDFNTVEFVKHSRACIIDLMIFRKLYKSMRKIKAEWSNLASHRFIQFPMGIINFFFYNKRTRKTFTRSIRRSSIVALIVLIQSQLDSMKPNKTRIVCQIIKHIIIII